MLLKIQIDRALIDKKKIIMSKNWHVIRKSVKKKDKNILKFIRSLYEKRVFYKK